MSTEKISLTRYSLEHLNEVKYLLIFCPVEIQVLYSDEAIPHILKHMPELLYTQLCNKKSAEFKNWNATTVGNCAYIVINGDERTADKAKGLLSMYQFFVESFKLHLPKS